MTAAAEGRITTKAAVEDARWSMLSGNVDKMNESLTAITTLLNNLLVEYRTEHVRVVDKATSAHQRIDRLEGEVEKITVCMERMRDDIRPMISMNKILVWIGVGLGSSIIALIWSILTHQVALVFP